MNCPKCNVRMQKIKTNEVFYGNIVVEDIEALKCKKCGETFFDGKSYDATLKKIKAIKNKIPLPVLAKIKTMVV